MYNRTKKIASITLAISLIAVCVNMLLGPHHIAAGGITGLAIILESWFGFDRSLFVLAANAVILLLTPIFLGKEIFINTVIGALLLPLFIGVIPQVKIVEDTALSMVAGSVLFGIAVTILYRNNASSGGTSIPPLILKKYFGMNASVGLFITDGIVIALSLFIFSVESFVYAIFSVFITSASMNYIESGVNKKKMVYIISDKHREIMTDILYIIGRGVTIIPVIGAYKEQEMKMLLIALNARDYRRLITIVDKYDKTAFMITDTVSDVHGEGFSYESGSV